MSPLDLTTPGALVQTLDILQGLARHLPMSLLHVGGLLLRDRAEDGLPEIRQEWRDGDGDGEGHGGSEDRCQTPRARHGSQQAGGHGDEGGRGSGVEGKVKAWSSSEIRNGRRARPERG